MRIIIAGGTGFIGTYLKKIFEEQGDVVKIISRSNNHIPWIHDRLVEEIEQADLLVNLAGRSINCRHTPENKKQIVQSRLDSTALLGNAVAACKNPPALWINASASAIYKPSERIVSTEQSSELATDFLSMLVRQWEDVFFSFQTPQTRQVALRTSVVLGRNEGAFPPLLTLARLGLGGKVGTGKQIFSWIHIEDYFRIIMFIAQNLAIKGVVNCTSSKPVSNAELMRSIRKNLGMPVGLPAPEFAVKIGALLIGTESDLLLNSSNLYPEVLMNAGFEFEFKDIDSAITDLIHSK
jgi:hypothetical protein